MDINGVQDSGERNIKLDLTKFMTIGSQSRVFASCVVTRGVRGALIVWLVD